MGFFEKIDGFFEKTFFFKIDKGGKFAVECVSNSIISLKCLFRQEYAFWQKKLEKFERFGKIRKCDEDSVFSRRKRFHLLKRLLYKNGKAQNMLEVAGCLVLVFRRNLKLAENSRKIFLTLLKIHNQLQLGIDLLSI